MIGGLHIEKFQAQEGPHALVKRLLIDDRCRLGVRLGLWIGMRVHAPILSQPTVQGKPQVEVKSRSWALRVSHAQVTLVQMIDRPP